MAYPFFSLAKSKRIAPIDFAAGNVSIRVEAVPDHGMATIWDADILIWAASQIVEARDSGLRTSRLMAATPYEILTYVGRGTGLRDYQRLKAALDRLQSTTISTSIRQPVEGRRHRFSWINEWQERTDHSGRPDGIEMIVPDWFYQAVLDDALVLTIDRTYFDLTGGLDRWLYRLVRKLLTVVTKSNAQRHGMVMWDEIAAEVSKEFPDVTWDKMLVDAMTVRMVKNPQSLDTIVATNLHADILSDLAGALAGSLGVAPTGNIDPERRYPSMFEPIHGSAFDITGKGIANPVATFWTAAQMLEHLGEGGAAKRLMTAVEQVCADGVLTPDVGGDATTQQVTDAVCAAIRGANI